MAPALVRLHNFKPGKLPTSIFSRETEAMHIQSSRSNSSSSNGGVETSTIIFIVVGVVCLLVLLIGFCLVSRPRVASNAAPSVPSSLPQHSPIAHSPRPRRERDRSEHWRIWKTWYHTSSADSPTTAETPTSQVEPTPTITTAPRIITPSHTSKAHTPVVSRPSQSRRITSLSVTTSFTHSHITEEDLNNFRLSAYDLDDDLESEMLHSARDDVWLGQALAVEEGCSMVGMSEAAEARGNVMPVIEGSAEGYATPGSTAEWKGGDYENVGGTHQGVASGKNEVEVDVDEVGRVAVGRTGVANVVLAC